MTLLDLIHALRLRLDDLGGDTGTPPSGYSYYHEYDDSGCLFSNAELTRYLNEAENEFCRRKPIIDTAEAIYLTPGISTYDLEPYVLAVQRVYSPTRGVALVKTFETDTYVPGTYYQERPGKIQILGTPTKAERLDITVQRLPLEPMAWTQRKTQEPEINLYYHSSLIDFACFLAFQKRDADTSNPAASLEALAMFDRAVGPSKSATDLEWNRNLANRRPRARAQFV